MANEVKILEERLGYAFEHPELLEEALRHASYTHEQEEPSLRDNERLEFLGDAVLDLAVSHILMELFKSAQEGDLSKYRASVVNEKMLSQVAGDLGLGEFLLLGRGEEMGGGREKISILADSMEALLGAVYLDGGFEKTMGIIRILFLPLLMKLNSSESIEDYKSLLQEYTQDGLKARPDYIVIHESGPSHDRLFRVAIYLRGKVLAEGEGKSKKEAEQKAAREAFLCMTSNPRIP
jgi:ribonuclease III